MLLAIPYWLLAQWLMGLVAAGATPALLCIAVPAGFSALLFVGLGPWSLVLLARARAIEAHQAWRARRTQPEPA
ncbi:hypothetical protein [Leucobacter sp. UCD-THU]|uniref:hypothetical protein n=1 Tax=Leucobacter sp. UCD-THU TaxID=1292023 RepID=UPI001268A63F|nr:hypothetical protein [Leucobacter sp. UCD-THU]